MISKYTYKGLTWIDLESPTEEEVAHVSEEYAIPATVGEDLYFSTVQSKIDLYPTFIYLTLHFPQVSHLTNKSIEHEIDFIIGDKFIITTHYEFVESLHEFTKTFEVDAILEKKMETDHAGVLFYHLIRALYTHTRYQLHEVNLQLKEAEAKIFEGAENKMVATISNINRTLLDFRQALRFHKEVLNSFEIAAKQFFGDKFGYYISSMISEYTKTRTMLDDHKDILDDLRETNDSLLASKTTEIMRVLTVVTFLTTPAIVIANIFVMKHSFFANSTADFYIVLLGVVAFSILIFIYFKLKKWI